MDQGSLATIVGTSRRRFALYAALTLAWFVIALALGAVRGAVRHEPLDFAFGDGKFYYVYLPSLVIDHDLDFANQMHDHWGKQYHSQDLDERTARGYVNDKYPIGPALSLAPTFLITHAITSAGFALTGWPILAPTGYSPLYQITSLATILAFAWATLAVVDRIGEKYFRCDPAALFLGIVGVALGSVYAYYALRSPLMPHIISNFWVTASAALSARIAWDAQRKGLQVSTLILLTLSCSMALICRPTNIFIAVFVLWAFYMIAGNGLLPALARRMPLAIFGCAPIAIQLIVWHRMTGHWLTFAYRPYERFFWSEPVLLKTLFSPRAGLFVWSPILLLAFAGVAMRLHAGVLAAGDAQVRFGTALLVCFLFAFVILWYFNSAWWSWYFGDSFGGRPFIEILSLFMLGLTFFADWVLRRRPVLRRAWLGIAAGCVAYTLILMIAWDLRVLPRKLEPPGPAGVIFARGHM